MLAIVYLANQGLPMVAPPGTEKSLSNEVFISLDRIRPDTDRGISPKPCDTL